MKSLLLSITILIVFMSIELISFKECYGQSPEIQRLQQEIRDLSVRAMEAYDRNNMREFNSLSKQIKAKRDRLENLTGRGVEFDPDEDRNGCIDSGEANRYELITGHRYTGPKPRCGPDIPSW